MNQQIKTKMATLYKTDGTITDVSPRNGRTFELDELYDLLTCDLIEIINVGPRLLVIDEEGKFSSKPHNQSATDLAAGHRAIFPGDYIVGDALLCDDSEIE